jgi:hypothetical protein
MGGNWKLNPRTVKDASKLAEEVAAAVAGVTDVE